MNIIGPYIALVKQEAVAQSLKEALDNGNWQAQLDLANACDNVLTVLPPADPEHGWGGFANVDQAIELAEIKRVVLERQGHTFDDLVILGRSLSVVFTHLSTKRKSDV